jgi:hypothetical protein
MSTCHSGDFHPPVTWVTEDLKSLDFSRQHKSSDSSSYVTRFPYPHDQNPTNKNKRCQNHSKKHKNTNLIRSILWKAN